eukprot:CAMPEP_0206188086 /NCGR_PEP_ID=MMETSP0166-20121206/3379_1 /ASSEMBLY_ACC=CAM_ASM_000260 /TAXON_ID=95228 /ORGANISM="Vannella robusta, Strain DIVA3 518/3/11/1/6" /LENGTH=302 /DNA_ID=CAMNT_0053603775 /DNA_START=242 /DNA_END=1147 /DNA_ORIENTATION=+
MAIGAQQFELPEPGSVLISEGSKNDHVFYIHKGSVDVVKLVDGVKTILASAQRGEFVGDISFLRSLKSRKAISSTASIITSLPDTEVTKLPHDLLYTTFSENEQLAWRFYFLLAATIAERLIRLNYLRSGQLSGTENSKAVLQRSSASAVALKPLGMENLTPKSKSPQGKSKTNSARRSAEVSTSPRLDTKTDKKYTSVRTAIGESILQTFSCKFSASGHKKGSWTHGALLLSRNHICLYRKVFGRKTQIIIPSVAVENVTAKNDNKTVCLRCFSSTEEFEEFLLSFSEEDAPIAARALDRY